MRTRVSGHEFTCDTLNFATFTCTNPHRPPSHYDTSPIDIVSLGRTFSNTPTTVRHSSRDTRIYSDVRVLRAGAGQHAPIAYLSIDGSIRVRQAQGVIDVDLLAVGKHLCSRCCHCQTPTYLLTKHDSILPAVFAAGVRARFPISQMPTTKQM